MTMRWRECSGFGASTNTFGKDLVKMTRMGAVQRKVVRRCIGVDRLDSVLQRLTAWQTAVSLDSE